MAQTDSDATSEKDGLLGASSLKIEVLKKLAREAESRVITTPPVSQSSSRKGISRASKIRGGVAEFFDKRKDHPSMNLAVDIGMVVFGLGVTALLLAVLIWIIGVVAKT